MSQSVYDENNIVGRTTLECHKEKISLINYMYDDNYARMVKSKQSTTESDGLVDSIKQVLVNGFYNPYLLNLLLSPF